MLWFGGSLYVTLKEEIVSEAQQQYSMQALQFILNYPGLMVQPSKFSVSSSINRAYTLLVSRYRYITRGIKSHCCMDNHNKGMPVW